MAKILLAGEDAVAIFNVAASLAADGHEVLTSLNGYEAFEVILTEVPDMVLIEPSLPVFNGFETCERIRNDPTLDPNLPVIFITADKIHARKIEEVEATDQIPKVHASYQLRDMLIKYLGVNAVSH